MFNSYNMSTQYGDVCNDKRVAIATTLTYKNYTLQNLQNLAVDRQIR